MCDDQCQRNKHRKMTNPVDVGVCLCCFTEGAAEALLKTIVMFTCVDAVSTDEFTERTARGEAGGIMAYVRTIVVEFQVTASDEALPLSSTDWMPALEFPEHSSISMYAPHLVTRNQRKISGQWKAFNTLIRTGCQSAAVGR